MTAIEHLLDRDETSVPLYAQIAENLLDQIESGQLSPGDCLPSERELSEKLGVNRMTLRRALRMLEDQGLLIRRRGSGTYVAQAKNENFKLWLDDPRHCLPGQVSPAQFSR